MVRIEGDAVVSVKSTTLIVIQVHDRHGIREIKIPYMALHKPEMFVEHLSKNMVFVKQDFEIQLQRFLHGQVRFLQLQGGSGTLLYYKTLGWQYKRGSTQKEFVLGGYKTAESQYQYFDTSFEFVKGTSKGQRDFIKTEILPYAETRLALTIGLSSIVAGYIEEFKPSGTFIINVCAKSTSGKSTIAELSGSLFGSPESSTNGIVRDFNATDNAILAANEGRIGLPILLDDITANQNEHTKKKELVYKLASNNPKGRCQNTGSLQEKRSKWSGIAVITSETPLFDNENVPQGINARYIELADITWTQSAEHSERIKAGVRKNFGHLALEFANVLQELGTEEILKLHEEAKSIIKSKFKEKDKLADRISAYLAYIKITADLLKKHFFKEFNAEQVVKRMIKAYDDTMSARAIEERALEQFKDFIKTNIKHFTIYTEKSAKQHQGDLYGAIIINNKEQSVNVLKPAFNKFVKECEIFERRRILIYWADKGYIKVEKGHGYDVKVSALAARATKLYLKPDEVKFYKADLYEPHCHNCGDPVHTTFGTTQKEIPYIGQEYEEYDKNSNLEDIFETGDNTDEN